MQINNVTNLNTHKNNYPCHKQAFGTYFVLHTPKNYFPKDWDDEQIAKYFNSCFKRARLKTEGPIGSIVSSMLRKSPLGFMHYPGYEHIAKYIQEDGDIWVRQRLHIKYIKRPGYDNLSDYKLPEIDRNNYKFTVLTNEDSTRFRHYQKRRLSDAFDKSCNYADSLEKASNGKIEREDFQFLVSLMKTLRTITATSDTIRGVNPLIIQLNKDADLTNILSNCFA